MSIKPLMVLVAVLLSLAMGFLGYLAAKSPSEESDVNSGSDSERIEAVFDRFDEFEARLKRHEKLLKDRGTAMSQESGLTSEEVRRIVADALRNEREPSTNTERTAKAEDEVTGAMSLDGLMRKLNDPNLSDQDAMALWAEIAKAGKTAEITALLEQRAKDESQSAKAQYELGAAYVAQLRSGNLSQQEMGILGGKADAAFDRTLALDEEHWDARFQKAVSLSFWPPILGRQGEARRHFETLIDQQGRRETSPEHAQTHLLLGNLLQQMGKSDDARAAWRRGSELFPQNQALSSRLSESGN